MVWKTFPALLLGGSLLSAMELARVALHATIRWDRIHGGFVNHPPQFYKRSHHFIIAHGDPLAVAMRVLLAVLALVENGYN